MQFLKSLLFNLFFFIGLFIVLLVALPSLLLPSKVSLLFGKFLAYYLIFLMKIILKVDVKFSGLENLKKEKYFFVASAHQSMFETFVLQAPINFPIFILKKELLKIPLFGWYLKKIGSIPIVRETTTKENVDFFTQIKAKLDKENRPLLIFPQGTRVKFGERAPFKKGAGRIYKALNIACIPVALNTGKVWPKNSFMKYPGNINISFLEPIKPGKDRDTFNRELEKKINDECERFI